MSDTANANIDVYEPSKTGILKNNDIISPERYVFWMDDVRILYKNENYIKFFPTSSMTRVEQLNSLTRFFIYLILILILMGSTNEFIYIPIIGIIVCIVLYNVFEIDTNGKREELLRMRRKKENLKVVGPDINYRTYQIDDDGEIVTVDIDAEERQKYNDSTDDLQPTDYQLETGYYDSNGRLQIGGYNPAVRSLKKQAEIENIKYSLDEMRLYNSSRCRRPTADNPFMNPSQDDLNKENVPVACNADDEDISQNLELKFNQDMYRDIEDVFDKKNSQRQFYTVAHNVPNDMEAFARWCYKFPANCKTNQERCLRYEDLRTKY
jgi:hypothetical protein